MFGKIEFRVLVKYNELAAQNKTALLRAEGFEVYDVKEAELQMKSDGTKMGDMYILCCKGHWINYMLFKLKYKLEESIYEGMRTLY